MVKKELVIQVKSVKLKGELIVPDEATGIVIFPHGNGSSRLSRRNKFVAGILQQHSFATLLFDLLTEKEDETYENRFNIKVLSSRLIEVTNWIMKQQGTKELQPGYFGASTGAASALYAAAHFGEEIKAVVSRGGRPDLAMDILDKVKSPVLLIVGSFDTLVVDLNRKALRQINSTKKLEVIPGASHLFEEPGRLEIVADIAAGWYDKYLQYFSIA